MAKYKYVSVLVHVDAEIRTTVRILNTDKRSESEIKKEVIQKAANVVSNKVCNIKCDKRVEPGLSIVELNVESAKVNPDESSYT